MPSLTSSVARLHRAGSEHSSAWQKLDEAARNLVRWLGEHAPTEEIFPRNCQINVDHWGDGIRYTLLHHPANAARTTVDFWLSTYWKNERSHLIRFAELVADGWLDEVSKWLEEWTKRCKTTTAKIESTLGEMQNRT
ncbi:MAG: hypothetical protein HY435_00135 [Candidatus Liptonbacteria bacterium]|nr:hypothetical protein [Candidatus Liptonbacteria bacterium]